VPHRHVHRSGADLSGDAPTVRGHFMGTSTFAQYTVMPEIALARSHLTRRPTGRRCWPVAPRPGSAPRSTQPRPSRGSTCVVFGAGKGGTLDIVPRYLITGRRGCGSSFGGVKGRDQVQQLVQLYLDGRLDVDPFISHRITLDEVNHGVELMERQDGIRSVMMFD
jgi:Zn-dependent alcohol dehydrogenase